MTTAPIPVITPGSGNILVRVKACSFSPSDYRMMSGEADLIKKPKSWPYIPGESPSLLPPKHPCHDLTVSLCHKAAMCAEPCSRSTLRIRPARSSQVAAAPSTYTTLASVSFSVICHPSGDSIVGTWDLFGIGGLAEYTLIASKKAALKPLTISDVDGAALANSASHAVQIAEKV